MVKVLFDHSPKEERRGSQAQSALVSVRVNSQRIFLVHPVKLEGITVPRADTHLEERLTDVASEGESMKPALQKYFHG